METGILIQGHAKEQEQGDHHGLQQDGDHEVLLGVLNVLAGQGALHHVLVQTRHGDDGEHAAQQLFPEILGSVYIVEVEEFHVAGVQLAHLFTYQDEGETHRRQHAQRLENIHADDGLHAAAHGVEPHQQHGKGYRNPERYAEGAQQQ